MATEVRPAEPRDDAAVARLLYESAGGLYDLFAGSRDAALRLLAAAIAQPGNEVSRDGVLVAEVDGSVAGALAAFPTREGDERGRRWLMIALRRRAPWHWPSMLKIAAADERLDYDPPEDSLYIDGLSTEERFRRRGVARALIEGAVERARALGLGSLALDTTQSNAGARALYESAGFRVAAEFGQTGIIPPIVFYVRELG
jgi:GNAT superfamily N-acetyltransferase